MFSKSGPTSLHAGWMSWSLYHGNLSSQHSLFSLQFLCTFSACSSLWYWYALPCCCFYAWGWPSKSGLAGKRSQGCFFHYLCRVGCSCKVLSVPEVPLSHWMMRKYMHDYISTVCNHLIWSWVIFFSDDQGRCIIVFPQNLIERPCYPHENSSVNSVCILVLEGGVNRRFFVSVFWFISLL